MNLPDPRTLHNKYQSTQPFPHIALKDVFDKDLLLEASKEFDTPKDWKLHNHEHVCNKFSFPFYDKMGVCSKRIIDDLSSDRFTNWLSKLTGYRDVIGDDRLKGGGLHVTTNGGCLDIHRDFNYSKYLKANRRLNVILFATPDWQASWHGELELWSEERVGKRIYPEFGNLVIFNTTDNYHGQPYPLNYPNDIPSKSIATYYYQVGRPDCEPHSTVYK